ncbi:MAG TPA: NADH-quinone oxidoreductase subunit NuoF [Gaiella sp.]
MTLEIVFAGTDGGAVTELADYEARGGLIALRRAQEMTPDEIIAELNASNLRGRGGAFFPTGRKWSFVPKPEQNPRPHYLVVNADESEPGTFKDREIMLRVPFRFLEGCLIAARAIESTNVFVYIRGEYEREFDVLVSALDQMRKQKLLGGVTIVLHRGAGAYICGEETALLESLEGERGQPRTKPPFPAIAGLYASPTAVNNVESITTVTPIIEMGGARYAEIGPESSTGTRVFSLSGNVARPGNYELPHGFPLKELIYDVGGGIPDGRTLKAVIPGGSSTPILTAAEAEKVTLDFDSLAQAGTMIGSAAVIAIDDRCCMVQLGIRVSQFYEHESCGKCTPCRVGTRWITQILKKLEAGRGTHADLDLLLDVGEHVNGTCLCPLGDSDAIAVASYVAKFRDEFLAHVETGGCPFEGESSLDGVVAPTDVHEAHVGPTEIHRPLEVVA